MPTTVVDNSRRGPEIVSGYDFTWTLKLTQKGTPLVVSGATIQAALVSRNRSETLIDPVSCSSSAPGADWSAGLVTVEFPAASTADLQNKDGEAFIELSVTLAGKRIPFQTLATIHTGRIP